MHRSSRGFALLSLCFVACFADFARASDFATDLQPGGRGPQADNLIIRKIFVFPGSDDVGNVLAPELDEALIRKLEKNSRFQVVKNPKIGEALKREEKGYNRVIVSPEVHARAARLAGADTTVVLETRHVGHELRVKEEWRRADGSLLFSETQGGNAKGPIEEQKKIVERATDAIIARIPFLGTVTGRTGDTITIDLNADQASVGDKLTIARVVSTKEHPLLKTLVNIDYVTVGTAEITSVDNVLSFAKVTGEPSGEQIGVEHKVVSMDRFVGSRTGKGQGGIDSGKGGGGDRWGRLEQKEKSVADPLDEHDAERLGGEFEKKKARYGMVGGKLLAGTLGHDESLSGVATELSAFGFGGSFIGELWITKQWLLGLGYEFMSATLKGTRAGAEISAAGTSWTKFDIYGGYRYLPEDTLDGTVLTLAVGYESLKMTLPLDTANQLGGKSYSGVLFMVSGDIALDPSNRVEASIGLQPFSSLGEIEYISGTTDGAHVVHAAGRWQHMWKTNLFFHAGVEYSVANGAFKGGKSMTEKRFAITPGLKYLF